MRFFQYNNEIVNLTHVANFTCLKEKNNDEEFILTAHLNYSHGYWDREEMELGVAVNLGKFQNKDDGLQIARDIIAGIYDLPLTFSYESPVENETPTETETPEAQEQEQEIPDDPTAKEKAIENAREQLKQKQTKVIAAELNIDPNKIYGEIYQKAQHIWGNSHQWDTEQWQNYIIAIADFQQRKGILYDKLKPQQQANGNTDKNTEKGPF